MWPPQKQANWSSSPKRNCCLASRNLVTEEFQIQHLQDVTSRSSVSFFRQGLIEKREGYTCVYCKLFTTIQLLNALFTSHNYHFVVVVMVNLYFQNNFRLKYSMVNDSYSLYIYSLELTHLMTESLYPLTSISPFPPHSLFLAPGNHYCTICFYVCLTFLDSTFK